MNNEQAVCGLCGEPMPEGEEMFNYHGYSGPCPTPKIGSASVVAGEASASTRRSAAQDASSQINLVAPGETPTVPPSVEWLRKAVRDRFDDCLLANEPEECDAVLDALIAAVRSDRPQP